MGSRLFSNPTVLAWVHASRARLQRSLRGLGRRWHAGRLQREVRPLIVGLESSQGSLAGLTKEVETRFLACGRSLHEQVGITSQMIRMSRQLVERDEQVQRGDAAIARLADLSARQLALSGEFSREVLRLAATLAAHGDKLRRLHTQQKEIERSFAPIRVLQALFRIEAATLSTEMQTLFLGVADEMRRLEADVSASFVAQEETFANARREVDATAKDLHARANDQVEQARTKVDAVRAAQRKLESEFKRAHERHQRLDATLAQIDRETDAVTVSLQFQDITRQKLEHVQTAAQEVMQFFSADSTEPVARMARRCQILCQVQDAQLNAVQDDLGNASATITRGLEAVRLRLQEIETDSLSVASLRKVTAGLEAVTAETVAAHRLSAELVESSFASLTDAVNAARGFAAATTGATDAMRRMAGDIHLMGLNAQVQAVQADSGTLETLSGAASQISREARLLGERFEATLVEITAELATLLETSEKFRDSMQERYDALQREGTELARDLAAEQSGARQAVEEVGQLIGRLGTHAESLLQSVDLADFSRDAIAGARGTFSKFAGVCARYASGAGEQDEALLAETQARYTMESERLAHAQALGGAVVVAAAAAGAATEVELFEADLPITTESPVATAASAPTGERLADNVELF